MAKAATIATAQGPVKEMRVQEALREALRYEMSRDERVFVMGEDVALFGGAYYLYRTNDSSRPPDNRFSYYENQVGFRASFTY